MLHSCVFECTNPCRMNKSIILKYVFPFLQWYVLMILSAILIDAFLHQFGWDGVGRYLGYVGTFLIAISFVYSLRKRKYIKAGNPMAFLKIHEYVAWSGSVLILVHAGIHLHAILPWLAVIFMLINVASGLVGKFLLKQSSDGLAVRKKEMMDRGMTSEEVDRAVFYDAVAIGWMRQWRVIHLPIAFLFGLFSLLHIITVLLFTR